MNAPTTPREHIRRVLHAYDQHRALGASADAAIDIAATSLRLSRQTVIRALRLRDAAFA
jgi:hypothetical protein